MLLEIKAIDVICASLPYGPLLSHGEASAPLGRGLSLHTVLLACPLRLLPLVQNHEPCLQADSSLCVTV